ncbi:MAG: chemotaxis protein CheX [Chloroflexi bacterium HGW-Chloroflexi-10]|nr:MAG: chemotaxis protein CheX [Chloroflexi bacterium HGW-Chloroflexi-10]
MNVKFLNPFVEAAFEVMQAETGVAMQRGDLSLEKNAYITDDVTVIIALVGMVDGTVFYSMTEETAVRFATKMLGEKFEKFTSLAQSGIAELGNVITGRASVKLAQTGYEATISPPTVLIGKGASLSTLDYPRIILPMSSELGRVMIHLSLRQGRSNMDSAHIPVPNAPLTT